MTDFLLKRNVMEKFKMAETGPQVEHVPMIFFNYVHPLNISKSQNEGTSKCILIPTQLLE